LRKAADEHAEAECSRFRKTLLENERDEETREVFTPITYCRTFPP
jgi:hypothetical protein